MDLASIGNAIVKLVLPYHEYQIRLTLFGSRQDPRPTTYRFLHLSFREIHWSELRGGAQRFEIMGLCPKT